MMRLVRFLMLLAGSLFLMAVFRTIMGAFKAGFATSPGAANASGAKTGSPEVTTGGELKKCAACGTYNAVQNSLTKARGTETVYYCSSDCRAKHAA